MSRLFCLPSLILALLLLVPSANARQAEPESEQTDISDQISELRASAELLIEAAMADSAAWDRLAYLTDTFGPRFSGSKNLELAIDWILEEMVHDGLQNVRGEPVKVPHWVRGEETLVLLEPHERRLEILGLGGSVGTGPGGVTGEVLVVNSYDDLAARGAEAKGKIVLWNVPFTSYGATVTYRSNGAVRAAEAGAIASLVRSVGPYSMYTPHTGNSRYDENVPKIPHAAVTVEDAMMMQRMQDRGHTIRVRLEMQDYWLPDADSHNVVGELVGSEYPEEIIVMGGHIDSWDVGTGAMDDAGGCVVAWEALRLLQESIELAQEVGLNYLVGYSYSKLGNIARDSGRYDEALEYQNNALNRFSDVDDVVMTRIAIGDIYVAKGLFEEAESNYTQARTTAESASSRRDLASALNALGSLYTVTGRLPQALQLSMQSLRISEEVENTWGMAAAYTGIGNAYNTMGTNQLAILNYELADSLHALSGNELARATPINNIGTIYYHQGDYASSLPLFEKALRIQEENRIEDDFTVLLQGNIGAAHMKMGHYDVAQPWIDRGLEMSAAVNHLGGDCIYVRTRLENAVSKY